METITTRTKVLAVILLVVAAFATGRYTVKPVEVVKHETEETTKKEETDTHTEIVETKQPDGSTKKVTTIDRSSRTDYATKKETETKTTNKVQKTNISALVSVNIRERNALIYGISVTREILGPVTVGVFGLTNGTVGASIGINF